MMVKRLCIWLQSVCGCLCPMWMFKFCEGRFYYLASSPLENPKVQSIKRIAVIFLICGWIRRPRFRQSPPQSAAPTLGLIKNQPESGSSLQRHTAEGVCGRGVGVGGAGGGVISSVPLISITPSRCRWDRTFTAGRVMKIHLIKLYWPPSPRRPTVATRHYLTPAPLHHHHLHSERSPRAQLPGTSAIHTFHTMFKSYKQSIKLQEPAETTTIQYQNTYNLHKGSFKQALNVKNTKLG